ncbi:hypothetical protein [Methylobrevis pamukkalensis]|uniref:Uncharacterized protein n=1 Tax=Methylobrevis pamukkalensis TaxID=1439726 RepID=A0A1E3GYR7_9HYPH|nr:hypothetical protein [Methylobrevis pamukkalensis]ODN69219.1 hypothetical protein A6302_03481 [Methylobrevis pamukkalensis]
MSDLDREINEAPMFDDPDRAAVTPLGISPDGAPVHLVTARRGSPCGLFRQAAGRRARG